MIRDHLEKIRYFSAICDAKTFRKAAEILRISQSSLTVAVNKLEKDIGTRLLIRTKRGVHKTPAGQTLFVFAKELAGRVADLEIRLRAPNDPLAGRIRIGAYDSIAIYWLPAVMRKVQESLSNVDVSISIGSSLSLIKQLNEESIDMAIVVEPPTHSSLSSTVLFSDHFSFFATQRVAKEIQKKGVSRPIIAMADARISIDQVLGDTLRQRGYWPSGIIEVESFEIAKALSIQEVGIAVLPHRVAELDLSASSLVKIRSLPVSFGRHRIALIERRRGVSRSPLIQAFFGMMIDNAKLKH